MKLGGKTSRGSLREGMRDGFDQNTLCTCINTK